MSRESAILEGDIPKQTIRSKDQTWKRDTESSLVPLGKKALTTQVPRLLCHTRRRPECLDR